MEMSDVYTPTEIALAELAQSHCLLRTGIDATSKKMRKLEEETSAAKARAEALETERATMVSMQQALIQQGNGLRAQIAELNAENARLAVSGRELLFEQEQRTKELTREVNLLKRRLRDAKRKA